MFLLSEALKKYAALLFAAALCAGTVTTASADSFSAEQLAAIPDIPCRTPEETLSGIPDIPVIISSEDEKSEPEIMTETLAVSNQSVNISISFSSDETPDAPETGDTPETDDTPDVPETKDVPLRETISPMGDIPAGQRKKRLGDVDEDSVISSNDALIALRITIFGDGTPVNRALSDTDGDGFITSNDALDILRYSNGFPSEYIDAEKIVDPDGVRWFIGGEGRLFARLPDGSAPEGLVNIGGFVIGFGEDGVLLTGDVTIGGVQYTLTECGVLLDGWQNTEAGISLYSNGTPAEGWADVFDQRFFFRDSAALTGWQTVDGISCYFDDFGAAAKGFTEIDGKTYYFDDSLNRKTGLTDIGGRLYLLFDEGGMAKGWTTVGDSLYYFKENGAAAKGVEKIDGEDYFFEDDSTFESGFIKKEFGTIYKDDYGFMKLGFFSIGDSRYYFAENGAMATGSVTIEGRNYLFGDDGVMITGWYRTGNALSYLLDGETVTGSVTIDGEEYFFENDGILYTGRFLRNGAICFKDDHGVNLTGWQEIDGETYYLGEDGHAATGFTTIEDKLYCFDDNGCMLRSTKADNYRITETGECIKLTTADASTIKYFADDIIESIGANADALCHYVHGHIAYVFVNEPMVYGDPYRAEWDRIAAFGYNKGYGACYHYSALLHVLFQRAGFTSRIVVGTGYYPSLHSYNELLVDGEWVIYDALYDYCAFSIPYTQSLGFTINHLIDFPI